MGGGVGKWRHASFHFNMPVKRVVAGATAAAILVGLQPLQGTWSLGLSFKVFFPYTMAPKEEEKEKSLSIMKKDESCERKKPIS